MRYLVIANIEYIEASRFLVACLYGEEGYLIDELIIPFKSYPDAIQRIQALAFVHSRPFQLWTADRELFKLAMETPGVAVSIKYPSDTRCTGETIEQHEDILRELLEVIPLIPKPSAPKWRAFLVSVSTKIIIKLKGDYDYE